MKSSGSVHARSVSPFAVGLIGLSFGIAVVSAGLAAADWDPDAFVHARDGVAATDLSTSGDPVGYDGQFFYRLARAPLDTSPIAAGIELDRPAYRHQRIGYPAVAWVVSLGGRASLVPWALIAVNVAALGLLAGAGASIARHYGRHTLWGAALAAWPGFLIALRLDLSDILAAALLLVGLERVLRGRPHAWVWFASAALTRETALLLPLGFGAAWIVARARGGRPDTTPSVWLGPVIAWSAWQLLCFIWYGKLGVLDSVTTGAPLRAVVASFGRLVSNGDVVSVVALAAVVAFASLGLTRLVRSAAPVPVRLAVVVATAILITRNWAVWTWWQGYTRASIDVVLLASVMLFAGGIHRDRVIVLPEAGERVIDLDVLAARA